MDILCTFLFGIFFIPVFHAVLSPDLETITFSDVHGPKCNLLDNDTVARRYEGCCYSVAFTARELRVGETLHFNITETDPGWMANLNVGIIYTDPDDFLPGSLVTGDANISNAIPNTTVFIFQKFYSEDNIYEFHVDYSGVAYLSPNVTYNDVVFTGVDINKPFWVIFNIYGDTKAVKLLGTSSEPETSSSWSSWLYNLLF